MSRRRLADIYLPSYLRTATALDLAVSGPQLQEVLGVAVRQSLAAAKAYADVTRAHPDTAAAGQSQGVRFLPVVAETTGPCTSLEQRQHAKEPRRLPCEPNSCNSLARLQGTSRLGRPSGAELRWRRKRLQQLLVPLRRCWHLAPSSHNRP